ncbi:hypothetical protein [Sorangium atrum]|uniref:Uncharacterized protein n=1 Tax=Sorangium atrum TaxID=2995308 RepID=A0ABT5CIQ1_9BACT|nr:hypothetical protein [Sorangium aterium]MDC0684966.1 hypothetical protein [Sorangium aterium]
MRDALVHPVPELATAARDRRSAGEGAGGILRMPLAMRGYARK